MCSEQKIIMQTSYTHDHELSWSNSKPSMKIAWGQFLVLHFNEALTCIQSNNAPAQFVGKTISNILLDDWDNIQFIKLTQQALQHHRSSYLKLPYRGSFLEIKIIAHPTIAQRAVLISYFEEEYKDQDKQSLSDLCKSNHILSWEYQCDRKQLRFKPNHFPSTIWYEVFSLLEGKSIETLFSLLSINDQMNLRRIMRSKSFDSQEHCFSLQLPDHTNLNVKAVFRMKLCDDGLHYFGTIQETKLPLSTLEQSHFSKIIDQLPEMVGILDHNFKATYLNQAAQEFINLYSQEDQLVIPYIPIESTAESKERFRAVLKREGKWHGEGIIVSANGEERIPIEQLAIANKDEHGNVQNYYFIIRNLSSQKRVEENLLSINQELDTFLYRASHDLKGPIASLLGLCEIMKIDTEDNQSRKYFQMIDAQAQRLSSIVNNLMELITVKARTEKFEPLNFNEIVEESIASLKYLAPQGKSIDYRVGITIPHLIYGDKSLISSIMQNLIENAIKYSRENIRSFVKIRVKTLHGKIIIEVVDNGIGIPKDFHDKIFNMFFRANNKVVGTGLGLYILKNAVEKLKGKIYFRSIHGEGSIFRVRLPY